MVLWYSLRLPFSLGSGWCVHCASVVWEKGLNRFFDMDQMARSKIRSLYKLLEICKYFAMFFHVFLRLRNRSGSVGQLS